MAKKIVDSTEQDEQNGGENVEDAFSHGFGASAAEVAPEKPDADDADKGKSGDADDGNAAGADADGGAAAEVDPWEGVPAKVRESFESLSASVGSKMPAIEQFDLRLRAFEGRWGQMQKALDAWTKMAENQGGAAAASAAPGVAPTQDEVKEAAGSTKRWDELKESYPEWAEALEERLAIERAAKAKETPKPAAPAPGATPEEIRDRVKTELEGDFQSKIAVNRRDAMSAVVELKHEGWESTVNTPDFKAWYAKQSADVKALGASDHARDAIKLLDKYGEAAKKAKENARRLRGNETKPGVPVVAGAEMSDEDAMAYGFNK